MKENIPPITSCSAALEKLEFFKQFNIYETIHCNEYIYRRVFIRNRYFIVKEKLEMSKVEVTNPAIEIHKTKVIDTVEGTSLEGQYLSGKKLIVVGEINFSLVTCYSYCGNHYNYGISKLKLPFSTFIIIPKDICEVDKVNLRYLVEDVSIAYLGKNKMLTSATILIQYIDEYVCSNSC